MLCSCASGLFAVPPKPPALCCSVACAGAVPSARISSLPPLPASLLPAQPRDLGPVSLSLGSPSCSLCNFQREWGPFFACPKSSACWQRPVLVHGAGPLGTSGGMNPRWPLWPVWPGIFSYFLCPSISYLPFRACLSVASSRSLLVTLAPMSSLQVFHSLLWL